MNEHDLHGAFDDLARRGAEEQTGRMGRGDGISAERVTAVARRVRRRRAAVTAVAGFALLGGATVAGATVLDRPAPPQPAVPAPVPSPSTTPEPAPTSTATVLPTGDPALPFGACGALATADPTADAPLDDRWSLSTVLAAPDAAAGGGLAVSTRIDVNLPGDWSPIGIGYGIWPGSGPQFLVLREGVVVGTGDLYGDVPAALESYDVSASASSAAFQGLVPLRSCADGRALPPGDYALVATSRVLPLGDDPSVAEELATAGAEAVAARHPDAWRRAVGAALEFAIVDGDPGSLPPAQAVVEPGIVPGPTCGAPLASSEPGLLTWEVMAPARVPYGSAPDSAGALGYAGPGRLRAGVETTPAYWAVQDGIVVGGPPGTSGAYYGVVDLGRDRPLHLTGPVDVRACADGWPGDEPLAPGTYTVVPSVLVSGAEVRTPEGTRDLPSGVVTGKEFTLVVE